MGHEVLVVHGRSRELDVLATGIRWPGHDEVAPGFVVATLDHGSPRSARGAVAARLNDIKLVKAQLIRRHGGTPITAKVLRERRQSARRFFSTCACRLLSSRLAARDLRPPVLMAQTTTVGKPRAMTAIDDASC